MMLPTTNSNGATASGTANPSSNTGRTKQHTIHRRRPSCDVLLLYLLLAATVVTLLSIFGPTLYIVQSQTHHGGSSRSSVLEPEQDSHGPPRRIIQVDELEHEEEFRRTIKSCLPMENAKACGEYVPEPHHDNNKKVQRVAVISPPGDISDALWSKVDSLAQRHNLYRLTKSNNSSSSNNNNHDLEMEVILTSHVPPYGYGKTHGLTKIVRLVPHPLLLEVTDALTNLLEVGETYRILTLSDLTAALRMILRLHCRLSHVAAHTALQSVWALDLWQDPESTLESLRQFLTPHEDHHNNNDNNPGDDDLNVSITDDDQIEMLQGEAAYATQILTHVQATSQQNVLAVLDRVLVQEMEATHHFAQWPCPSFWAAGHEANHNNNNNNNNTTATLSPLLQRLARALSPDCADPYNTCFVQRDQCEFQGQADCPGSKQQKQHHANHAPLSKEEKQQ